jgi:hypothetical protein
VVKTGKLAVLKKILKSHRVIESNYNKLKLKVKCMRDDLN